MYGYNNDDPYGRPPPPPDAYQQGGYHGAYQGGYASNPPPPPPPPGQGNGYGGSQGYGGDKIKLFLSQSRLQRLNYQAGNRPPPPPGAYSQTGPGYNPADQAREAQEPPFGHIKTQADEGDQQGFHYSACTGKRKALLIGINYFGTSGELGGCINDVHNVQRFIMQRFGYQAQDMVLLTDDARDARSQPTKANILAAMQWLVRDAQPNDALFLHYSGHGTQTEDVDGDEGDDDDEAICPVDYEEAGLIIDDDNQTPLTLSHEICVKPLPEGCRLTAIFDSCHSGTVMDLPYVYSTEGKIKGPDYFTEDTQQDLMAAGMGLLTGDTGGAMGRLFGAAKDMFGAHRAAEKGKKNKSSKADVIQWSGCKDEQTSADTQEEGKATGAMSYAFITALQKYPRQSYMQLLNTVREAMHEGNYTQRPQLSASHPIDTDLEFIA